jgi:hypothetical protein
MRQADVGREYLVLSSSRDENAGESFQNATSNVYRLFCNFKILTEKHHRHNDHDEETFGLHFFLNRFLPPPPSSLIVGLSIPASSSFVPIHQKVERRLQQNHC